MSDLEKDQTVETSSAAKDVQIVQIAQADETYDVDMDPPGTLSDPPHTP